MKPSATVSITDSRKDNPCLKPATDEIELSLVVWLRQARMNRTQFGAGKNHFEGKVQSAKGMRRVAEGLNLIRSNEAKTPARLSGQPAISPYPRHNRTVSAKFEIIAIAAFSPEARGTNLCCCDVASCFIFSNVTVTRLG